MRVQAEVEEIKKFATKVRLKRYELRLSQEKISELIGCHVNHYGRIERGTADPSLSMMIKISRALEISLINLLS